MRIGCDSRLAEVCVDAVADSKYPRSMPTCPYPRFRE